MQKRRFTVLIFLLSGQSLFAGVGFGIDMNYVKLSGTAEGTYRVSSGELSGFSFSPHFRYNIPLGSSAVFGIGFFGSLGSSTPSDLPPTIISISTSMYRAGGELYLAYQSSGFALPFLRVQAAKDFFSEETVYKVGSTAPTISVSYGGLILNFLGGLKIPFNDVLAMYIHGGVSIAPQSSSSAKNMTNDSTAVAATNQYNALNPKISYTGFLLGGGLSFEF